MARIKKKSDDISVEIKSQDPGCEDSPSIMQDQRHRMIAETAYRFAELRCFQGDCALDDWLQAESEVEHHLTDAT